MKEQISTQVDWKKIFVITALILLTGLVIGSGVWYIMDQEAQNQDEYSEDRLDDQAGSNNYGDEQTSGETNLESLDSKWYLYKNSKLGFSIKIPKKSYTWDGSCELVSEGGKQTYRPNGADVPISVFEGEGSAYIAPKYVYKLSGEQVVNLSDGSNESIYSKCEKVENSYDSLVKDSDPDPWNIKVIKEIEYSKIDGQLKKLYGSGCSLDKRVEIKGQDSLYEIIMKGDGLDLGSTKCPVNFVIKFLYSGQSKNFYYWELGQAASFYTEDFKDSYDTEMINSFTLLER